MSGAWWEPVGAVATTIPCSGRTHDVRWDGGRLHLDDHDDVEAEQTLGALGGDLSACVVLARAWQARSTDPALVTLGRRPGEPGLGFSSDERPAGSQPLHTPPPPLRRGERDEDAARRQDLLALFGLPAPFIDRLVLTAMAAAADQWPDPAFRDRHGLRIGAALAARADPALRRLGRVVARADEPVVVHCTPAAASGIAIGARRVAAALEVTASVPLSWLSRVWGPGVSEPEGRFVLALHRRRNSGYEIDVAEWVATRDGRWEAQRRPAMLIRHGDLSWRIEGRGG